MRITGANLLKLLGALGTVVGVVGGTWAVVDRLQPEPPAASVQFVLDTSAEMQKPLGNGRTKLSAARRAILREVTQRPNLAYSLRLVGGVCAAAGGEPVVSLERRDEDENDEEFREAFREIAAGGKSNFANGIARATSDLVEVDSKSKSIIAFVAGADACSPNAADIIENAVGSLGGENIAVQVRLLALDAPRPERQALRTLTRRLQGTMAANVSQIASEDEMQEELSAQLDAAADETMPGDTGENLTDTGETGTTPTDTGELPPETGEIETTPPEDAEAFGRFPAAELAWPYWVGAWGP
jgi:hypothetical protein